MLARDGFFYVGGKTITDRRPRPTSTGQMYVEMRIPAKQTHPYPIIMVHGGTLSGTTFTGTPDGREGWAQYFVRQRLCGLCRRSARHAGAPAIVADAYGPLRIADATIRAAALRRSRRSSSSGRRRTCTRSGPAAASPTIRSRSSSTVSQLPAIEDFAKQQSLKRDALIALLDKIGPSILMTHSQGGAFGWPVADARPDMVKAVLAIEPNGPPVRSLDFIGAPDWFKEGRRGAAPTASRRSPLTYEPAVDRRHPSSSSSRRTSRTARPRHAAGSRPSRRGKLANLQRCRSWS